jgi:hypothetical protein
MDGTILMKNRESDFRSEKIQIKYSFEKTLSVQFEKMDFLSVFVFLAAAALLFVLIKVSGTLQYMHHNDDRQRRWSFIDEDFEDRRFG